MLVAALVAAPAARAAPAPPEVPLAAYVVMDAQDGKVLAQDAARERRSIASLTKMMTARLVLRDGPLTQTVEIPAAATTIGESVVGLRVGQTFTRRELLEGLVVWSGNDAAEALALAVGGSDEGFARLANREAARLGMKDSRYITAYGLDRAGQYSTALDQARLARVLMRDPRLRKAVRLRSVTVNGQTFAARNKLLGAYPGLDGVKTGHTDQAGWSLAASAVRGGRRLIVVGLGGPDEATRDQAIARLLDWGFDRYRRVPLVREGAAIARLPAVWQDEDVPVVAKDGVVAIVRDGQKVRRRLILPTRVAAGDAGTVVGRMDVTVAGKEVGSTPLVLGADVPEPSLVDQARWLGGHAVDRLLDPSSWF